MALQRCVWTAASLICLGWSLLMLLTSWRDERRRRQQEEKARRDVEQAFREAQEVLRKMRKAQSTERFRVIDGGRQ